MKNPTKAQLRKEALKRHYNALEKLVGLTCGGGADGKKLSTALLKLERQASKAALNYCNGVTTSEQFEVVSNQITLQVQKLFRNELKGFFVNGDPRGYALKINDKVFNEIYRSTGLQSDWGGYGILSPDIQ